MAERQRKAHAMLEVTERRLEAGCVPADLLEGDETQALGLTSAIVKRTFSSDIAGALREALQPLSKDRSFNPLEPDDTYRDLDNTVSADIDILMAGHTHLERALPRRASRGIYYNTGTWTRLINLTEQDLSSAEKFQRFFNAFSAGTMQALDDAGIVLKRPTFASVWLEDGTVCAELRHVLSAPSEKLFEPATTDGRTSYRKGP